MRAPSLPDGPSAPPLVQTLQWGLRPAEFMQACRRRHGDAFTCRFAGLGTAVFVSDPTVAKALFATGVEDFRAGKTKFLEPILGEHSLLCLDGDEHLRQRRLLLPAMHGEHLQRVRELIDGLADREIAGWRAGEELRLSERMHSLTLDVILAVVFGLDTGPRRTHLRALIGALRRMSRNPLQLARLSLLRRDLGALPHRRSGLGRLLASIDGEIAAQVAERRRRGGDGPDVLGILLAARDENGHPMTGRELRDELMTMLLAGHETTAASLAWAFERLVRHRPAWERLRAEARDGEVAWADAVVAETLRTRPVLWLAGRRLCHDTRLAGLELPAGTLAYVCSYLMHTRADLWPAPYRFAPERFLAGRPAAGTFTPFGGGRRRCIGAAFAEMEMRTVLMRTAASVDLVAVDARAERMARRGFVVAPAAGARVRVAATACRPAHALAKTSDQQPPKRGHPPC